ncbi:MAG: GNAT family N-acetyltransferase [Pseudomonadota bacterium]|nr:GNAT family N-acetyltransferase [Pseudomonadota bacterium]
MTDVAAMAGLDFVPLWGIAPDDIARLMNDERVGRYLPLLQRPFTARDCQAFLDAKRKLWDEHGYGPCAILIGGQFAGWGGLQPEQGDVDFALVLRPEYWGWGRRIFDRIKAQAFSDMRLQSITILLPPGRHNTRAVIRLGFTPDGQATVNGKAFERYRLSRP